MTDGVSVSSFVTDIVITCSVVFLLISCNLRAVFIVNLKSFTRRPKEYSDQPHTAHRPAVWHVSCPVLTLVKPDIFSIYENTQILAVQYHILLWFFCGGDESVILFQVNNNNIAMPQSAKTSSVMYKQQVIVKPPAPKQMRNKSILCKPYMHTKGVSCRPHPCTKETQTGDKTSLLSVLQLYIYGLSTWDANLHSQGLPCLSSLCSCSYSCLSWNTVQPQGDRNIFIFCGCYLQKIPWARKCWFRCLCQSTCQPQCTCTAARTLCLYHFHCLYQFQYSSPPPGTLLMGSWRR